MTPLKGKFKAKIMDPTAIQRSLNRLAHQIIERNPRVEDFVLIGIRTRGVPLATRLAAIIKGSRENRWPPAFWTLPCTATI